MPEIGCYIDGGSRNINEGTLALFDLLEEYNADKAAELRKAFEQADGDSKEADSDYDDASLAYEAEEALNAATATDEASWYWHDGDFGYWQHDND